MRVALLSSNPDKPSTRVRLLAQIPWWRRGGVEASYHRLTDDSAPARATIAEIDGVDVAVLSRVLLGGAELRALRRAARVLVFDCDDAVWLRDPPRRAFSLGRRRRFAAACRAADLVTAGNALISAAARDAGARSALVLPSCVDLDVVAARQEKGAIRTPRSALPDSQSPIRTLQPRPPTLAWIGSKATLPYFEEMCRHLAPWTGDPVDVLCLCDREPSLPAGLRVRWTPWSADTEYSQLAQADLGLAPLPQTPWTRGKSAFKVVQYGAVGLPVIASPVGAQSRCLAGVIGWSATHPPDWRAALRSFLSNRELAAALGGRHRAQVERCFSWQALWPRFAARLERLVAAR